MNDIKINQVASLFYATARTPLLPNAGLIATGKTYQEAINNLNADYNCWLEKTSV